MEIWLWIKLPGELDLLKKIEIDFVSNHNRNVRS